LKDKERLDRVFDLVRQKPGNNSFEHLKTIEEDNSSSFITINDSENEESKCNLKENKRKLKMNSLNNSREFNVCFDEDISLENSILFYDPKGVLDPKNNSSINMINNPKNEENISRNFSKNKKKHTKKTKKQNKHNEIKEKVERFMTLPSCSMPNLKYRRDLVLNLKPKKTKNIYLRISKNGTFCKAKISIIYPKNHQKVGPKTKPEPSHIETNISNALETKEKEQPPTKEIQAKKAKKTIINPSLSTIKNKTPAIIKSPELQTDKLEDSKMTQNQITTNQNLSQIIDNKEKDLNLNEASNIRWCQLCNLILADDVSNIDHLATKAHKKFKSLYGLTSTEDIITFQSGDPGNEELKAERLNAYKKRCKKIKQSLASKALKHETASLIGKESISPNKQRLQRLCIELEKQILPQIKDYNQLETSLKEGIKLLEQRREADLHIMRQLKFVPLLMEICKKLTMCHRNEINDILRTLDVSSNLLSLFCGLVDNRTYMLITNRLIPLVDLLLWCLNRPTKFVYSLGFVPVLFNILTTHLKHRLTPDRSTFKEYLMEYIFSSGFLLKIKQKFMSFTGGLDLSTCMGKVPLALLKSLNFIEMLTNYLGLE